MTLLAATYLPDSGRIVAVADRLGVGVDSSGTTTWGIQDKWMALDRAPRAVWGWAGSDVIAFPLGAWLAQDADLDDWLSLADGLSKVLKALSLTQPPNQHLTSCLVAGFIGGQPGILKVEHHGGTNWDDSASTATAFVGNSQFAAAVAWQYVERYAGEGTSEDRFCNLIRLVVEGDPFLNGFVEWHITDEAPPNRIICEELH